MKLWKNICFFFQKNKRQLIQFLIIYLCVLSVSLIFHTCAYPLDTDTYVYYVNSTYYQEFGLFRFDLISTTFRGYFFSWFLAWMNFGCIGNLEMTVFLLPAFVSVLFSYFLPKIVEVAFSWKVSFAQKLIVCALFLFFSYGLVIYYLSDFYAFAFALIAVFYAYKLHTCKDSSKKYYVYWFLMGASCYIAYNIRTIYLVFAVVLLIILILDGIVHKNKTYLFGFLWFLCGATLFAIPQIFINWNILKQLSPLVLTETGGDENLFLFQLKAGLFIKKYETFLGTSPGEIQALRFFDEHPLTNINIQSMGEYFQIIFSNFFSYLRLLFVHLFNMIDIRFPEVYIKSLRDTTLTQTINYAVIGLSLSSIILQIKQKAQSIGKSFFQMRYILALLFSCLCIVPGAVETRFGIPVLIILWCFGLYHFPKIDQTHRTKNIVFIVIVIVAVLYLSFYAGSKIIYTL